MSSIETGRLRRERVTMQRMVEIYCAGHHATSGPAPCAECEDFLAYVDKRLEKCPYGPEKPTCARCPIHCYKPEPREHARTIMRYAGPRMVWRHPWLSLMHFVDKARRVEHPMEARRRERASNEDSGGA
jgi:predicted amidophosphoribosyltransferase